MLTISWNYESSKMDVKLYLYTIFFSYELVGQTFIDVTGEDNGYNEINLTPENRIAVKVSYAYFPQNRSSRNSF